MFVVVAGLAVTLLSCEAKAQPANDSSPEISSAFEAGDFKTALRLAQPLADKGDAQAEHILGLLYSRGWGVELKAAKGAECYQKAAQQGVAAAQNNLGSMYFVGEGVPKDYAKAAYWFRKAADQGAVQPLFNLGRIYEEGLGTPQDYKAAAAFYRQAAQAMLDSWVREHTPPH